ncbi:MAG: aspartate dehydrogenase [Rhodospirillales bacterium]|nr:aspartate dehydrogenase [Rhodospirillales bacterium]
MKIAIVGLGAIGREVAKLLEAGRPRLVLAALSSRDPVKSAAIARDLNLRAPVLGLAEAVQRCDVVVDCAVSASLKSVARAAFAAGRTLVTVNASALLGAPELYAEAETADSRIVVASGALLAFDAVAAAAVGRIERVEMRNRKPPRALSGAPFVVENKIDLEAITAPTRIFAGTARQAAAGFPANVNVAAALSLAGIGPDRTLVEIWADPTVERNIHEYEVVSDSVRFSVRTEGIPSPDNPKTSAIVPLSVVATLDRLAAPVRIGT